jgi:hypothetical protein
VQILSVLDIRHESVSRFVQGERFVEPKHLLPQRITYTGIREMKSSLLAFRVQFKEPFGRPRTRKHTSQNEEKRDESSSFRANSRRQGKWIGAIKGAS